MQPRLCPCWLAGAPGVFGVLVVPCAHLVRCWPTLVLRKERAPPAGKDTWLSGERDSCGELWRLGACSGGWRRALQWPWQARWAGGQRSRSSLRSSSIAIAIAGGHPHPRAQRAGAPSSAGGKGDRTTACVRVPSHHVFSGAQNCTALLPCFFGDDSAVRLVAFPRIAEPSSTP